MRVRAPDASPAEAGTTIGVWDYPNRVRTCRGFFVARIPKRWQPLQSALVFAFVSSGRQKRKGNWEDEHL